MKYSLLIILLVVTSTAFSHPGRTASDGCHYCRTNCDKWGVPWNVRHCHNAAEPFFDIPVKYDIDNLDEQKDNIKDKKSSELKNI